MTDDPKGCGGPSSDETQETPMPTDLTTADMGDSASEEKP